MGYHQSNTVKCLTMRNNVQWNNKKNIYIIYTLIIFAKTKNNYKYRLNW